ncbi:hypothetical protein CC80DRAFT_356205, partial [Byssothecium circinans]
YGNKVIPISDKAVVKYGRGVKIEEFNNLEQAYHLLDPSIVRVPQPYRFFEDDDIGYLVMIYMKGNIIEEITDPFHISQIGRALRHFSSFQSTRPGPLGGGISRGLLWGEGTTPEYSLHGSVENLEHWFNRRLKHNGLCLSFKECDFVLCHLDIAPRNMLWLPGESTSLAIVDWASAGYYPRMFEWCLLNIFSGKDGRFQDLVKETMEPFTEWEKESQ